MPSETLAHCNFCNGERNHAVLYDDTVELRPDLDGIQRLQRNEVVRCLGCNTVAFRRKVRPANPPADQLGKEQTTYFPPAISRREPNWIDSLADSTSKELLRQVYVASQNGINRLGAMGVRALIEHVMIKECGDQGSFARNLEKFHEQGHLSTTQRTTLEVILEAGHASMHRDFDPSESDVTTLIDTVEIVLEQVYIQPGRVAELKQRIPERS